MNRQRNLLASSQQTYAFLHIGEHTLLHCSGVEWMPIRLTIPRQNSFPHGRFVSFMHQKFIDMPTVCVQFVHLTQAFSLPCLGPMIFLSIWGWVILTINPCRTQLCALHPSITCRSWRVPLCIASFQIDTVFTTATAALP